MQQIAVPQHGLQWGDPGVGAQYEEAVVARLLGQLAGIDLEAGAGLAAGARRPAQIAPVGGIADQRLVAARELLGEPRDDRLPLIALAFRFGLVASEDVARAPTLTSLTKSWVSPRTRSTSNGVGGVSSSSTSRRTTALLRSRAPRTYSSLRSSSAAIVAAEIMPRSATTQTRPI